MRTQSKLAAAHSRRRLTPRIAPIGRLHRRQAPLRAFDERQPQLKDLRGLSTAAASAASIAPGS